MSQQPGGIIINGPAVPKNDGGIAPFSTTNYAPREMVYIPGATFPNASPWSLNQCTDFTLICAALKAMAGEVQLKFDASHGAITIPSGTYDFGPNCTWDGDAVALAEGVVFAHIPKFRNAVTSNNTGTSPFTDCPETAITIDGGMIDASSATGPMIRYTIAGTVTLVAKNQADVKAQALSFDAGGTLTTTSLVASVIEANALTSNVIAMSADDSSYLATSSAQNTPQDIVPILIGPPLSSAVVYDKSGVTSSRLQLNVVDSIAALNTMLANLPYEEAQIVFATGNIADASAAYHATDEQSITWIDAQSLGASNVVQTTTPTPTWTALPDVIDNLGVGPLAGSIADMFTIAAGATLTLKRGALLNSLHATHVVIRHSGAGPLNVILRDDATLARANPHAAAIASTNAVVVDVYDRGVIQALSLSVAALTINVYSSGASIDASYLPFCTVGRGATLRGSGNPNTLGNGVVPIAAEDGAFFYDAASGTTYQFGSASGWVPSTNSIAYIEGMPGSAVGAVSSIDALIGLVANASANESFVVDVNLAFSGGQFTWANKVFSAMPSTFAFGGLNSQYEITTTGTTAITTPPSNITIDNMTFRVANGAGNSPFLAYNGASQRELNIGLGALIFGGDQTPFISLTNGAVLVINLTYDAAIDSSNGISPTIDGDGTGTLVINVFDASQIGTAAVRIAGLANFTINILSAGANVPDTYGSHVTTVPGVIYAAPNFPTASASAQGCIFFHTATGYLAYWSGSWQIATGLIQENIVTLATADLIALGAVATAQINIAASLPVGAKILANSAEVQINSDLVGPGLTAATVTVEGGADVPGTLMSAVDIHLAAAGNYTAPGSNPYLSRSGQQLKATIHLTGATFNQLTNGNLTIRQLFTITPS